MLDLDVALRSDVLVAHGIVRVPLGDAIDLAVERRREEHRLAIPRSRVDDALDVGAEAHVEHAVGLVEDEDLGVLERDGAALHEVEQAARGGHQDLRAAGELRLLLNAGAAVDGRDREVAHRGDRPEVFSDLKRELARGGDDERRAGRRFQAKLLDDRSGEGKGLARSGGGLDEDVAAGESVADHERLDCKRFCDASLGEGIADGRGHAKIREGLVRHIGAFFFATRRAAV